MYLHGNLRLAYLRICASCCGSPPCCAFRNMRASLILRASRRPGMPASYNQLRSTGVVSSSGRFWNIACST